MLSPIASKLSNQTDLAIFSKITDLIIQLCNRFRRLKPAENVVECLLERNGETSSTSKHSPRFK